MPGAAISTSCAVPCSGRSWPKWRHHWMPTVHASHTNGAPEWMPTSSAGGSGMRSQPSISWRNQKSMSGFQKYFCLCMKSWSGPSRLHSPARSATQPAAPSAFSRRASTFFFARSACCSACVGPPFLLRCF